MFKYIGGGYKVDCHPMGNIGCPYGWNTAESINALLFVINVSYTLELIRSWHHHRTIRYEIPLRSFITYMLTDIWKVVDIICCFSVFIGTMFRYFSVGQHSERELMSVAAVLMAFKLIYFFRAFETTGRLVAYMIKIVNGIGYLLYLALSWLDLPLHSGYWCQMTHPRHRKLCKKVIILNLDFINLIIQWLQLFHI